MPSRAQLKSKFHGDCFSVKQLLIDRGKLAAHVGDYSTSFADLPQYAKAHKGTPLERANARVRDIECKLVHSLKNTPARPPVRPPVRPHPDVRVGAQLFSSGQRRCTPPQAQANGKRWSTWVQRLPSPCVSLMSSTFELSRRKSGFGSSSVTDFNNYRRDTLWSPGIPL